MGCVMRQRVFRHMRRAKAQLRPCIRAVCPRGYKTFNMPNSAEHEISPANKYENANANYSWHFHVAEKFSCSAMFNKKEFAIVSNLRFIIRKKFMLS